MRRPAWRTAWSRPARTPLTEVGSDPDYRFTLANERTFLAWIRTSLALMAAGVAVAQLLPDTGMAGARRVLGVLLILLGAGLAAGAYARWERAERAIRLGQRLPFSLLPRLLGGALALVGLGALVLVALGDA